MPIPTEYDKIALKLEPHKRTIVSFTGLGFIIILLSMFLAGLLPWNIFPLIAVGFVMLIWSWGLFLAINWFAINSRLTRMPKLIRAGLRWYAAFFLDIWFVVGSLAPLYFTWRSFFK